MTSVRILGVNAAHISVNGRINPFTNVYIVYAFTFIWLQSSVNNRINPNVGKDTVW